MNETHYSPSAGAYAQALLELANQDGQAEQIGAELESIGQALASEGQARDYLGSPSIKPSARDESLVRLLQGQASEVTINTIRLMNDRNKLSDLPGLIAAYKKFLDQQLGNVEVDVTVAQPLNPDETENVRQQVSRALGKNARINVEVDESIIGGLVVKIGDKLIDGSVKAQLSAMKEQLLAAK